MSSTDTDTDSETRRLPFPLRPLAVTEFCDFLPESRDVVLVSYPKCDTKVIEIILWKLLRSSVDLPAPLSSTHRYLPCVEIHGLRSALGEQQWPRLLKTHLPRVLVPIYQKAKYIYVVRNPWDAVVACYRTAYPENTGHERDGEEDFDSFLRVFINNEHGYGNVFDHVRDWASKKNIERQNFIALTYENIKWQPRSALYTVAAFLGEPYLNSLVQDDSVAAEILKELERAGARHNRHCKAKRAMRSTLLTAEHVKIIEEKMGVLLKGTDIEYQWKSMLKEEKVRAARVKKPENQMNQSII